MSKKELIDLSAEEVSPTLSGRKRKQTQDRQPDSDAEGEFDFLVQQAPELKEEPVQRLTHVQPYSATLQYETDTINDLYRIWVQDFGINDIEAKKQIAFFLGKRHDDMENTDFLIGLMHMTSAVEKIASRLQNNRLLTCRCSRLMLAFSIFANLLRAEQRFKDVTCNTNVPRWVRTESTRGHILGTVKDAKSQVCNFLLQELDKRDMGVYEIDGEVNIMEQVRTANGTPSGYWVPKYNIPDFLRLFGASIRADLCKVDVRNLGPTILSLNPPQLTIDRMLWSFEDGIYDISNDTFRKFTEGRGLDENYHKRFDEYFPTGVSSMNYFPTKFNRAALWSPGYLAFKKIFVEQGISDEVIEFFFGMLGRMLRPLNTQDHSQLAPIIIGMSRTGKNKIVESLLHLFSPHMQASITSPKEKELVISSACSRAILAVSELTPSTAPEPGLIEPIISGEPITMFRKYKQPIMNQPWTTPSIWVGNGFPFQDRGAGSILERCVIMRFTKPIPLEKRIDNLADLIKANAGELLVVLNRYYIDLLKKVPIEKSLFTVAPAYFKETRLFYEAQISPIASFINALTENGYELRPYDPMGPRLPVCIRECDFEKMFSKFIGARKQIPRDEYNFYLSNKNIRTVDSVEIIDLNEKYKGAKYTCNLLVGIHCPTNTERGSNSKFYYTPFTSSDDNWKTLIAKLKD